MKIIDLTFSIETDMPTCGTPWHQTVDIEPMGLIDTVGRNTHRLLMGSHAGTHMDAPYHFIQDGKKVESLDVSLMIGPATIVDFRRFKTGSVVTLDDVRELSITSHMIFVFAWYHHWKTPQYYKAFPYFETEAVRYLVDGGMKFMALDTPSPDDGSSISNSKSIDSPNHQILLGNEIMMAEYLNNTEELLDGKNYELIALPLKVFGSDGSPARVLAREIK